MSESIWSAWKGFDEKPEESGWYPVIYSNALGWHQSFFDLATGEWSRPNWTPTYWMPMPTLPNGMTNDNI